MSHRVSKPKAKKSLERDSLSRFFELNSRPAEMPCTYCFKRKLRCKMVEEKSNRCQECVRRGRPCDGVLVASSLTRLLDQQKRLEVEEDKAGEALLGLHAQMERLQSQMSDAVARLARIRKIKKRVKDRSAAEFERGMQELDKEDDVLPALESHEQWVVHDLQELGIPNEVDWSSLGLGDGFNDVGPLVPSCAGETSSGGVVREQGAQ